VIKEEEIAKSIIEKVANYLDVNNVPAYWSKGRYSW
jgi:hypothetical protein